jgi:hypothetical protein
LFCALACGVVLALAVGLGRMHGHAQSAPAPAKTPIVPAPDELQEQAPPAAGSANETRQQEIARQCNDLVKLAADMKAEVDKSTKDQLSVTVVRKASEIEQLAHKMRTGNP